MQRLLNSVLIVFLILTFSYPAVSEVAKLTIKTDSTWKALDVEQPGWTSNNYDDSWWEDVVTGSTVNDISEEIWYPGSIKPDTAYFRANFDINGDSFR